MPLFSFTSSMWIAFGVAFLFSAFYLWYLQWKWHKSLGHTVDSVFLVLAIFLQQSISDFQLKKAIYISAFIMSLLILSLFISASYSSGLASSMTIPRFEKLFVLQSA